MSTLVSTSTERMSAWLIDTGDKFITSVADTGDKFMTGVIYTAYKFMTDVIDIGGKSLDTDLIVNVD